LAECSESRFGTETYESVARWAFKCAGARPVTYGFFQLVNVIPEIAGAIGLSMVAIFGVAYLITGRWTIN
jgi:hypothetical protein